MMARRKVVIEHRLKRESEEQVREWLAGTDELPVMRGVHEVIEALVWTYVDGGRTGGIPAEEAMSKVDALMELQAHLRTYAAREK